jgi:hypothetical protein
MLKKARRAIKVKYGLTHSSIKIKVSGPTKMIQNLHRAYKNLTEDYFKEGR